MEPEQVSWPVTVATFLSRVVTGAIAWAKESYRRLKLRYGPRYAHAMVIVGFFALFLPMPGSSVVGVALVVFIAEFHRTIFKRGDRGRPGFPEREQKLTVDRGEELTPQNLVATSAREPQTVATPGIPHLGLVRRMLTWLGSVLKRAILGKSSYDYMKQFGRGDEYWDRVIAADRRVPRGIVLSSSTPEFEPIFGWTKRQLDDYLARNPGYRPAYEAELRNRCSKEVNEADDGPLDWCRPRTINRDKAVSNSQPNGAK